VARVNRRADVKIGPLQQHCFPDAEPLSVAKTREEPEIRQFGRKPTAVGPVLMEFIGFSNRAMFLLASHSAQMQSARM
jgi:hypothetical protein